MGGDEGGDGGASAAQQQEEQRKAALRAQINQLYGIDNTGAAPTADQFSTPSSIVHGDDGVPDREMGGVLDEDAFNKAMANWNAAGGTDPVAKAARDFQTQSEKSLSDSTRSFYNDQLEHASQAAFRKNKFALADRGTLGGSAQIDSERELSRDNTLGATRVGDKVAEAVSGLKNSQEQERLNAINLVNAGSGADAVQSAQAGLQRSLDNARSQGKADITGDLFSAAADQYAANQPVNPALIGAWNNGLYGRIGTFTNPGGGTARVTPT